MMTFFLRLIAPLCVLWAPIIVRLAQATPYFPIHNKDKTVYMNRWWVIFPRRWQGEYGARVQEICTSDDDRAVHDHPWPFWSIILKNGYFEILHVFTDCEQAWAAANMLGLEWKWERQTGKYVVGRRLRPGQVNVNKPGTYHRLRLLEDFDGNPIPATTLFITGPRTGKSWGFLVNGQHIHWRDYAAMNGGAAEVAATDAKLKQTFGGKR